jgi:hypothetical protein
VTGATACEMTGTAGSTDEGQTNETVPSHLADDRQPPRATKLRREDGRNMGFLYRGAQDLLYVSALFARWRAAVAVAAAASIDRVASGFAHRLLQLTLRVVSSLPGRRHTAPAVAAVLPKRFPVKPFSLFLFLD